MRHSFSIPSRSTIQQLRESLHVQRPLQTFVLPSDSRALFGMTKWNPNAFAYCMWRLRDLENFIHLHVAVKALSRATIPNSPTFASTRWHRLPTASSLQAHFVLMESPFMSMLQTSHTRCYRISQTSTLLAAVSHGNHQRLQLAHTAVRHCPTS